MKKRLVACLGAALFGLGPAVVAQQPVPEIPFDSDISFLKLPTGMNFGEASGVAVNSKGEIAVFTRSNISTGESRRLRCTRRRQERRPLLVGDNLR